MSHTTDDQDQPNANDPNPSPATGTPTDNAPPTTEAPRRHWFRRGLKYTFLTLLIWTVVHLIVPALPSPMVLAWGAIDLFKLGADPIYYAINEDDLQKSSEQVTSEAVENDTTGQSAIEQAEKHVHQRLGGDTTSAPGRAESDPALVRELKGLTSAPAVGGKVVNILLFGVDARMGTSGARADAIHLFTINPDSGIVDIMSIPRGSYYDCGFPDTTSSNIISHARGKGIERFLTAVEELTRRKPIRYYVEVGLSQALGILELLGYKDPKGTLRFLRSRKAFRTGDYQRSHNQSVFLRQSLIDKFSLLTGSTGDLLLSAGLRFVNTNLSKDFCRGFVYALQQRGFPQHRSDAVRVRMLPRYKMNLLDLLPDSANVARTSRVSDRLVGDQKAVGQDIAPRLREQIRLARADTARPDKVIRRLKLIVNQHIWLQISDKALRRQLRDEAIDLLIRANQKKGDTTEIQRLHDLRAAEDLMLGR